MTINAITEVINEVILDDHRGQYIRHKGMATYYVQCKIVIANNNLGMMILNDLCEK